MCNNTGSYEQGHMYIFQEMSGTRKPREAQCAVRVATVKKALSDGVGAADHNNLGVSSLLTFVSSLHTYASLLLTFASLLLTFVVSGPTLPPLPCPPLPKVGAAAGTCHYQLASVPPANPPPLWGRLRYSQACYEPTSPTHHSPPCLPPRWGRWQVSQAVEASTAAPVSNPPPCLPPQRGRGQVSWV
jgi:hypothetical protein